MEPDITAPLPPNYSTKYQHPVAQLLIGVGVFLVTLGGAVLYALYLQHVDTSLDNVLPVTDTSMVDSHTATSLGHDDHVVGNLDPATSVIFVPDRGISTIADTATTTKTITTSQAVLSTKTPSVAIRSTIILKKPKYIRVPNAGELYEYNELAYQAELSKGKLVLLYYFADWCPVCARETNEALYPALSEVTDGRFVAFRVNFNDFNTDNDERAIARKYQIAYQHSKVFVKGKNMIFRDGEEWSREKYDDVIARLLAENF